ncbi:MAG: replication initiator protein [Microviridae sp.]|nr:MAG: replication initiator protein [Microviridae sp.]
MPCYSPLYGYKSALVTKNGKRKVVFSRNKGFADLQMTVPCGQCIGCRIDRSRMWAIRCTHEAKLHEANSFITLTYDDEHLPHDNGLSKDHFQKFMKRLRFAIQPAFVRFFACGEYGDLNQRPHYHAVLFGYDFTYDRKVHSKKKKGEQEIIHYTSELLSKAWGMGRCTLTSFNYSAAAYTARYVMKKQNGKNALQHENYSRLNLSTGEIYQVQPEFALMSMRPGLGHGWYEKYKKDAFPSDFLIHEGKKHSVPRYYLDKLKKQNPEMAIKVTDKRKKMRLTTAADNTSDRLAVREECKKAQLSQLTRSL